MNIFLEASRQKLRFNTSYGMLSVEQLWDLSLTKLATIIRNVKKQMIEKSGDSELDFLDETKTVDSVAELSFNVLKEIYVIKKEENNAEKVAAAKKEQQQKILGILARKQDSKLEAMSEEELKALLAE